MEISILEAIPGKEVLAKDIITEKGLLLLKRGTLLTKTHKDRLKKFFIKNCCNHIAI